jgi:hypothetical protein
MKRSSSDSRQRQRPFQYAPRPKNWRVGNCIRMLKHQTLIKEVVCTVDWVLLSDHLHKPEVGQEDVMEEVGEDWEAWC